MLCTIFAIGAGITGCSKDDTRSQFPVLTAVGEATGYNSAKVTVTSDVIGEYAYLALPASEVAPDAAVVFKEGTVVTAPATFSTFNVTLDNGADVALSDYVVYVAGKVASYDGASTDFYKEVIEVPVTTLDFTDDVTILRTSAEGMDVHVRFPAQVAAQNKVVKWGLTNIAQYNSKIKGNTWFGASADVSFLELNDDVYPGYILRRDTTMHIDNNTRWVRDANGELIYDEWTGEANYYWDFVAPGEPLYLIMSEASLGEHAYGWGEGYYVFPFDMMSWSDAVMAWSWGETPEFPDQEGYWEDGAWHKRILTVTNEPKPYAGKVSIQAADLTPHNAVVNFIPDENNAPFMYTLCLMDHATYQQILDTYLDGNEEYMQWFVTSYFASMVVGTYSVPGTTPMQIPLSEFFWEINPGNVYHAFAVAMDGEEVYDEMYGENVLQADPSAQSFAQITFQMPDYTMEAPVLEVTALEPTSAFQARFNVKNVSDIPVVEASYAANYVREFNKELSYSSYSEIVSNNKGYADFSYDEVEAINSAEGLIVEFDSREEAQTRLAVMGWNQEGRPSNPDSEDGLGWADAWSGSVPDAERIESDYFTSLAGTWTATATVKKQQYDWQTGSYSWIEETEVSCDVTIGDVTYPELTDDVYQIYEENGVSKEETDVYYAQFEEQAAHFNAKTRGQNRILCTGWGFDISSYSPAYSPVRHARPWDLFVDTSGYNSSTVDVMFYDFGPKWFLQVAQDGSLFIPVNINRVVPLTTWTSGSPYYLVAANAETSTALYMPLDPANNDDVTKWNNIPVEVSEDGNTITIKAFDYEGTTYYPNVVYDSHGQLGFFETQNFGDVVLTRKSDTVTGQAVDTATVRRGAAAAAANKAFQQLKSANGAIYAPVKEMTKSLTPLKGNTKKVEFKKLNAKQFTAEQIDANLKKMAEKQNAKARK